MSLAWMTVDHRREDWPRTKHNLKSRIIIAWWHVRALWKWAAGFVSGFTLALALLNLIQARAEQEIIVDFTTAPAITAPATAEDTALLLSFNPASAFIASISIGISPRSCPFAVRCCFHKPSAPVFTQGPTLRRT